MREQPGGQQEVDPYPRGQQPEPLLDPAGLRQHGIDQIERHISRQLTRVTCVERIGRSPRLVRSGGMRDGILGRQWDL
jgi:hypothetical protein